jgi:hypothetical protein
MLLGQRSKAVAGYGGNRLRHFLAVFEAWSKALVEESAEEQDGSDSKE